MKLTDFLEQGNKDLVPIDVLTTLAGDKAAFGDDVAGAFRSQAELRSAAMLTLVATAETASRDLLADEARRFERLNRERETVFSFLRHVEQRSVDAYRVPASQALATETATEDMSPVLTRQQPMREWLTRRGGFTYQGERGADKMRLGAIVRGMIGHRQGLSPMELRALAEGSDSAGGYTVPEVLASGFIDRVRNAMVVQKAGAIIVPMTSDTLNLARLRSDGIVTAASPANSAANWKTENADISEGGITLERVQFIARTLPVLVKLSVELSEDSQNIDTIIETELAGALGLELDRASLLGSGVAPEPKGVRYQSGVGVHSFAGHNVSDHDFIVDAIGRVWGNNFEPNARITNADLATAIAKLKDSTGQPLRAPDVVAAVPAFRTNQIMDSGGGSPELTDLFVGDFTQLMIGMRTSFRLEVTRVAGEAFEKLQVWVRAYLRADVQLAHPEAFDVTINIG